MSTQTTAEIAVWATVVQWNVIGAVFFFDCFRVHKRASRQYKTAVEAGNGRIVVAKFRRKISRWFLLGSGIALALGILRIGQLTLDPQPAPEFRIVGAIIAEGIVLMLFAFWRTKRSNLTLQRILDERRYEETGRS